MPGRELSKSHATKVMHRRFWSSEPLRNKAATTGAALAVAANAAGSCAKGLAYASVTYLAYSQLQSDKGKADAASAETPIPTVELPSFDESKDLIVLKNNGPRWLIMTDFSTRATAEVASGKPCTTTTSLLDAFNAITEELQEDPQVVASTKRKLIFFEKSRDTAPTGICPGGRFAVFAIRKNETLTPKEAVFLRMVMDRMTISFNYKVGSTSHVYSESLRTRTEVEALNLEEQVAISMSSGTAASEHDKAAICLARLKYKSKAANKYRKRVLACIKQLNAEQQRLMDHARDMFMSPEFDEHMKMCNKSVNRPLSQQTFHDVQTGIKALHYIYLANEVAQSATQVEMKLNSCLATERELTAWHEELEKSIKEKTTLLIDLGDFPC